MASCPRARHVAEFRPRSIPSPSPPSHLVGGAHMRIRPARPPNHRTNAVGAEAARHFPCNRTPSPAPSWGR
jgi:hypothetical protein